MDREEREQIPWSSLIPDDRPTGLGRRYLLIGLAAALVAGWLGVRLLHVGGQPSVPPPTAAAATDTSATTTSEATTSPGMLVAEDDLRDAGPVRSNVVEAVAEWFVMDFFTVDGSAETVRSVRGALAGEVSDVELPHDRPGDETFVEWSRTVQLGGGGSEPWEAIVIYRSIRNGGDGFVRDPVRAVAVGLEASSEGLVVTGVPRPVDLDAALVVDGTG
jgi:hypothetical protein